MAESGAGARQTRGGKRGAGGPFLTCGTGTAGTLGGSSGALTRAGCLARGAADGGAWLDQGGAAQEAAPALGFRETGLAWNRSNGAGCLLDRGLALDAATEA